MDTEWFYMTGTVRMGPVSSEELQYLVRSGNLQATDKVRQKGMSRWVPVSAVKGLSAGPKTSPTPPAHSSQASGPSRTGKTEKPGGATGKPKEAAPSSAATLGMGRRGFLIIAAGAVAYLGIIGAILYPKLPKRYTPAVTEPNGDAANSNPDEQNPGGTQRQRSSRRGGRRGGPRQRGQGQAPPPPPQPPQ